MCEALRELMKDEIEEELDKARTVGRAEGIAAGRAEGIAAGRAEGIAAGRTEGRAEGEANIIRIMYDNGNSFEQIATYIGMNPDEVKAIVEGKK